MNFFLNYKYIKDNFKLTIFNDKFSQPLNVGYYCGMNTGLLSLIPLGLVVLLHDVSDRLTGQKEVSRVVKLQVYGVFIQYAEMLLMGFRCETVCIHGFKLLAMSLFTRLS